jgi:hypothetical protein
MKTDFDLKKQILQLIFVIGDIFHIDTGFFHTERNKVVE